MKHHSNLISSQYVAPQGGRTNSGLIITSQSKSVNLTSSQRPNIPRKNFPKTIIAIPVKQTNYRQIPVRTIEVNQKLEDLKNKFTPHLAKPRVEVQPPEPQMVAIRKVVTKKEPILQNIIPQLDQDKIPVTSNIFDEPRTKSSNQPWSSQTAYNSNQNRDINVFSITQNASQKPLEIDKLYSNDYQQKIQSKKDKPTLPVSNFYPNKKIKNRFLTRMRSKSVVASIMMFLISATIFGISGFVYYQQNQTPTAAVAGVSEEKSQLPKIEEYTTWITEKNGTFSEPEQDLDSDELTNYEEFIIDSNPLSANSCSPETTDSQNLFAFINPATCKPIDFDNPIEAEKFEGLISFPNLQEGFLQDVVSPQELSSTNNEGNLLSLFGVQNYSQLDGITIESLESQLAEKTTKKEYLRLVGKIDDYVKKYRSYEAYDRNYAAPVHPAVYLDISLKYQVPLKYTLAIARSESRFGTDRYTATGNLTRPGEFQNIYSMGLTDGGKNLKFNNWEDGVESFGKWYKKFQDRGVSNCAKWRIYNPNGDYCSKIEALASSIDAYLQST